VELVRRQQVYVRQVAHRTEGQLVVAVEHQQHPLRLGDLGQRGLGALGRRLLPGDQLGHHVHLTRARPVGQRTAQRGRLHLLRGALVVLARRRAVHDATTGELRRPDRTLAGPAGALLPVRLAATTADLAAGLGVVRTLPGGGQLRRDDLVHQRHVGLHVEDLRGQLDGARLLPLGGLDVHGGHAPAPPFTALRTNTRLPLGPGTAPLISSRPSSAFTSCTVRPCVVTRWWPIRPAIRMPLNTRPGVAQPPIEPGARWVAWLPWLAPWPAKPWRFMTPA